MPPIPQLPRPSTWFAWHAHRFESGIRVLDLACGEGRHSLAAAARARRSSAWTRMSPASPERESSPRRTASPSIGAWWISRSQWPDFGTFDAVLMFNYLDRARLPQIRELVAAGGFLMIETFLAAQRELGWGPDFGRSSPPAGRDRPAREAVHASCTAARCSSRWTRSGGERSASVLARNG